ncbi:MAG: hypothetical protein WA738_04925 [Candidatus Angelobacter sp.]
MSRKILLAAMLMVSMGLFGQRSGGAGGTSSGTSGTSATPAGAPTTQGAMGGISGQAAAGQTTTPSANTAGTPTVPETIAGPAGTTGTTQGNTDTSNNSTANTGGVITVAPVSPVPSVATPTATFDAPQPTAGISDAGRAGISVNTPINPAVTTTLAPSTMVYTSVPPVNVVAGNPAVGSTGASANTAATGGRLVNDLGPSYYADALPTANNVSVAEVATQFKALKTTTNARMLTNDDVQQMVAGKTGVTVAKNMPPLESGGMGQTATTQSAASQNASSQNTNASPGAAANGVQGSGSGTEQAQSGAAASQPRQGTPPPVSGSQGQSANADNSTTPQINQNQQSNDAAGGKRLPATSTLLPLLGLLGIVSGGIGMCLRRLRK